MKRLLALVVVAIFALATVAPVLADSTGYEGQPGNQGNGQNGYEGQPGNQGGGGHNP